jgi:8-hydroxy-5-deazaflavin:NADPH oxidoreductase
MKIGVLGTGAVGEAIGSALINKGHSVMMGSRTAGNEKSKEWRKKNGDHAFEGDFAEASVYGDLIFLCLNGAYAYDVVKELSSSDLANRIVVDVTNPLDFTQGMPPKIIEQFQGVSLGEQLQELLPHSFIVKALNTVNYKLMVDARLVNSASHNLFICGDDSTAKNQVKHFLVDNFYWKPESLVDLGGIKSARCTEAIVPFWVLVWQSLGTPLFNFKVVQ